MKEMSPGEIHDFLLEGTRTGKLATVREDGRPHVVPVWFVLDGDTIVFTTWHTTVKAENLRRDPRASFCVDDQTPPFAFVMIEGRVEIYEDSDELLHWTTQIARRYMGADLAEEYGRRNAESGELLVMLQPEKIVAQKELAE